MMTGIEDLERGTQVIYVPDHAEGRLDHPDSEDGFVTSTRELSDGSADVAFCRFWSKYDEGALRTRANSEACSVQHLVVKDTRPQGVVDALIERLYPMEDG